MYFDSGRFSNGALGAGFILATLLIALAPSSAGAAPITLDGVFDGTPPYSNSESVSWYNGHKTAYSIYGDRTTPLGSTTIHHGLGTLAGESSGIEYFFLYVEAPLYVKNMIWADIISLAGMTAADVAPYRTQHETHHAVGALNLDYRTATHSEKLIFNDAAGAKQFKANLAGDADNLFGLLGFMDSVDYVLGNTACTVSLCLARNAPMSFEFQFAKDTAVNSALLGFIRNGIEFHLSPERGLPISVPEPASILIFAFGLAGLGFVTRRRRGAVPA